MLQDGQIRKSGKSRLISTSDQRQLYLQFQKAVFPTLMSFTSWIILAHLQKLVQYAMSKKNFKIIIASVYILDNTITVFKITSHSISQAVHSS